MQVLVSLASCHVVIALSIALLESGMRPMERTYEEEWREQVEIKLSLYSSWPYGYAEAIPYIVCETKSHSFDIA